MASVADSFDVRPLVLGTKRSKHDALLVFVHGAGAGQTGEGQVLEGAIPVAGKAASGCSKQSGTRNHDTEVPHLQADPSVERTKLLPLFTQT